MMSCQDAKAAGYRVGEPNHPSPFLSDLCRLLGPEYHLATIDGGDVIHRVIGGGRDMEIYPCDKKRTRFNIVLWENYGLNSIDSVHDVPAWKVHREVERLISPCENETGRPARLTVGERGAYGL